MAIFRQRYASGLHSRAATALHPSPINRQPEFPARQSHGKQLADVRSVEPPHRQRPVLRELSPESPALIPQREIFHKLEIVCLEPTQLRESQLCESQLRESRLCECRQHAKSRALAHCQVKLLGAPAALLEGPHVVQRLFAGAWLLAARAQATAL